MNGDAPSRLVRAAGLAAGYGGPLALREVDFEVGAGEIVAVLGPNGGGKTTLFRALLGELAPARGSIEVAARPASVPQTERSRLDYPVSALDVVLMGTIPGRPWWRGPGPDGRRAARAALDQVDLRAQADTTFGELSGGQRQRVLVARALVQGAPVLLLDEPFSGLDSPSTERLMALLDRLAGEGSAIFVATHDLRQARRWDQVLCLNRRQIAFGAPDAVLTRATVEATYGGAIVEVPAGPDQPARGILPAHHHGGEAAVGEGPGGGHEH
jgi:ABC-type Mn2+/Zn2+ transport system ATPase subunit